MARWRRKNDRRPSEEFEIPAHDVARAARFYSSVFPHMYLLHPLAVGDLNGHATLVWARPGGHGQGRVRPRRDGEAPIDVLVVVDDVDECVDRLSSIPGTAQPASSFVGQDIGPDMHACSDTEGNALFVRRPYPGESAAALWRYREGGDAALWLAS